MQVKREKGATAGSRRGVNRREEGQGGEGEGREGRIQEPVGAKYKPRLTFQ
jgi:hypothetical protein